MLMTWTALSEADRDKVRYWQRWMIVFAVVCELFLAADWYAFAAVIPFLSPELGLNPGQAGFAQGVFALSYGAGMLVWGPISRSMTPRKMLMIGLAGTGLGMVAQVFVQGFVQLVALRLFIGFFDAAIWTGNIMLIISWFPQARRGLMMGLILAAYSLAITLDFAIGIPVTTVLGWRAFFAVLAAGTLIVALVDWLFALNGPADLGFPGFDWGDEQKTAHAHVSVGDIFRSRWIIVGGLAIAACTFAISATATWVIPAYIAVQKMPPASAALVGTIMGLSQVVFLVIGGRMADRMAKTLLIKISAFLAFLSALTFVAVTKTVPVGFATLLLPPALSGMAVLSGGAIFSLLSEKYPDNIAPAAVGYAEIRGVVATFIGPALLGAVINMTGSFVDAFWTFAAVEGLLLVILLVIARSPVRASAIQLAQPQA
jgi:MFS family permease